MGEVQTEPKVVATTTKKSPALAIAIALGWCLLIALAVLYDPQLKAWYDLHTDQVPVLEGAAYLLTKLIAVHILALLLLLVCLFDPRVRWRLLTNALWVVAAQTVVTDALKHTFGRVRPDSSLGVTIFCGPTLSDGQFGFPSGHASASFALAALFSSYYPRWRWFFIVGACLVAMARVQAGRHFIGDTVAGGVLGWYLTTAVLSLVWRRNRRREAARQARQVAA